MEVNGAGGSQTEEWVEGLLVREEMEGDVGCGKEVRKWRVECSGASNIRGIYLRGLYLET